MQKTFVPITFRDATKFCDKAKQVQLRARDPKSKRDFNKMYCAKKNLYAFSEKLVAKSAPEVFMRLQESKFAGLSSGVNTSQLTAKDYSNIARNISDVVVYPSNLKSEIDFLSEYKNSEEAKFSLKGQTFSSIMEHFVIRSHALMNHQGRIAAAIFDAIRTDIEKLIKKRSQASAAPKITSKMPDFQSMW